MRQRPTGDLVITSSTIRTLQQGLTNRKTNLNEGQSPQATKSLLPPTCALSVLPPTGLQAPLLQSSSSSSESSVRPKAAVVPPGLPQGAKAAGVATLSPSKPPSPQAPKPPSPQAPKPPSPQAPKPPSPQAPKPPSPQAPHMYHQPAQLTGFWGPCNPSESSLRRSQAVATISQVPCSGKPAMPKQHTVHWTCIPALHIIQPN